MAFNQFKLDRSVLQARGIFNKYIYETEDTIADVSVAGYFSRSRFIEIDGPDTNSNGWVGGIIECKCSDGYFVGHISESGDTIEPFPSSNVQRETVLTAFSTAASQQPTTTDSPIQLEFGVAQGSGSDPVQIDALGNLTINETDTYYLDILLAAARTGGASNSNLYGRLLIDGVQAGNSVFTLLDDDDVVIPLEFNAVMEFTAGQVVTIEIYRDSSGNNSGGVFGASPTLAGWADAPCCSLSVSRLTGGFSGV